MDFLKEKSPQHRPRFSEQTWLRQDKNSDPVLRRLLERWAQSIHFIQLTGFNNVSMLLMFTQKTSKENNSV